MTEIYLDNAATTKPCAEVIDAMTSSMRIGYYNPSALYKGAVEAEQALTAARTAVAAPLGMRQENVVFTSGGTESNNLGILGYLKQRKGGGTVLYSAAEHAAVRNASLEAADLGFTVKRIPLDSRGSLDLGKLSGMLDKNVRLIAVMQVCNETGIIMPIERLVSLRDRLAPQAAVHVDGVQGYLRLPVDMKRLNIQSYAVSAHKVHGPKGVGALIMNDKHKIGPLIFGGGHQRGLRAGTDNTVGAAGFAAAVKAYPVDAVQSLYALKAEIAKEILAAVPQARIIGPKPEDTDSAPHILCVSLPPVKAETMVHALEQEGVIVGTGSACSSRSRKYSVALSSMGVSEKLMDSAVRLSFSVQNTQEEVKTAVEAIRKQYRLLSKFTRR
ncbi:MAG: cysteine desulfurase [Clostridiales bacterium]|nr:cysteine desulfurase [Clostridiales bacterium]